LFFISEKNTLNKAQLFPGIYFYKVFNNENEVYSGKVFIE
jgi:hypothetical protein